MQQQSICDPLSAENYKGKLTQCIEIEKEEHRGQLKKRCKAQYHYNFIGNKCPPGLTIKSGKKYKMYGKLDGISKEDYFYVTQYSSSVMLTSGSCTEKADIFHDNQNQDNLCIFLAFTCLNEEFIDFCIVSIQFDLQESNYESLLQSVKRVPIACIPRLVPKSTKPASGNADLSRCKGYCSTEQLEALKIIVNSSPRGPPILLSGAFGTGKSRLLAISSAYFLTSLVLTPVRILICTQQQSSANRLLEYYLSIPWPGKCTRVYVVHDDGYVNIGPDNLKYYVSSQEFKKKQFPDNQPLLVITTCLNALHLSFQRGFFSHIFIDEASHMREPEAVAPLCFATEETKIVISGDTNQLGPANLVSCCEARANGLNISLFQRLETLYDSLDDCQIKAKLSCNYRCHPQIMELISNMFYNSSLQWDQRRDHPSTHHEHEYPLVFICSGVDEMFNSDSLDLEAEIVVETVSELVKQVPLAWDNKHPMKNFLITSPCENQVISISKKLQTLNYDDFPEIDTIFQGKEYQAVILSTTEPVNRDGSSRHSTMSFCDPYIFNTLITRAKSLVIVVGNPFLLLGIEKFFVQKYGDEHNAYCFSTYIETCIDNNSFHFDDKLNLDAGREAQLIREIRDKIINIQKFKNFEDENRSLQQENEELKTSLQKCEDEILLLKQQLQECKQEKLELELSLRKREEENKSLKQQLEKFEEQSQAHPLPSLESAKTSSVVKKTTGEGVQETPSRRGQNVMVQDDLRHKIVHELSITFDDRRTFVRKRDLGKGGFAEVYHVTEETCGRGNAEYALKVIKCDSINKKILREVKVLQELRNPRIVQYEDHCIRDNDKGWWSRKKENDSGNYKYLFILTELCHEDTLCVWLKNNSGCNRRSTEIIKKYFLQIVDGLIFIHKNGYVHRDLTPSNILFSRDAKELKIGDFGLVMDESQQNIVVSHNPDSTNTASTSNTFKGCGTPFYMSPEQKKKEKVDCKTDIYALGVILFEFFYPMEQSKREQVLKALLTVHKFPSKFEVTFPDICRLIAQMTEYDPTKRPYAPEVQNIFSNIVESTEFASICDEV